jgi:ATP-dependent Clp protease ATP-binding subunit ClpA
MATPDESVDDIFQPGGRLRLELLTPPAIDALRESLRLARETRWDSLRSPHVFMGLLARPDCCVRLWGDRLGADLSRLLGQFQELFHQEEGEEEAVLALNREFLSDNVIRLLRESLTRAHEHDRGQITPMDLLISLLTASNSIVADCFERIGVTAAKLTEQAVIAEHTARDNERGERTKKPN